MESLVVSAPQLAGNAKMWQAMNGTIKPCRLICVGRHQARALLNSSETERERKLREKERAQEAMLCRVA